MGSSVFLSTILILLSRAFWVSLRTFTSLTNSWYFGSFIRGVSEFTRAKMLNVVIPAIDAAIAVTRLYFFHRQTTLALGLSLFERIFPCSARSICTSWSVCLNFFHSLKRFICCRSSVCSTTSRSTSAFVFRNCSKYRRSSGVISPRMYLSTASRI